MTYSFPCQDLSSAGLGKGMAKDSGTRSGMLWEVERILNEIVSDGGGVTTSFVNGKCATSSRNKKQRAFC